MHKEQIISIHFELNLKNWQEICWSTPSEFTSEKRFSGNFQCATFLQIFIKSVAERLVFSSSVPTVSEGMFVRVSQK